jgi:hypothetical protein
MEGWQEKIIEAYGFPKERSDKEESINLDH